MSLSISNGFRRVSAWPYQYERGSRAFEVRCVGAEVAAAPSGEAGEDVCKGELTAAADMLPGNAQPPYTARISTRVPVGVVRDVRKGHTSFGSTLTSTGLQS